MDKLDSAPVSAPNALRSAPLPREERPQAKVGETQRLVELAQLDRWEEARELLRSRQWSAALDPEFGHEGLWGEVCDAFAEAGESGMGAARAFAKAVRQDGDWMIAVRELAQSAGRLDIDSGVLALEIELAALGDISRSRDLICATLREAAARWLDGDEAWPLDALAAKKGVREILGARGRLDVLAAWGQADPATHDEADGEATREPQAALGSLLRLERHGFVSLADGPAFLAQRLHAPNADFSDAGCAAFALLTRLRDSIANAPQWERLSPLLLAQKNLFAQKPERFPPSWALAIPLALAISERHALSQASRQEPWPRELRGAEAAPASDSNFGLLGGSPAARSPSRL